MQALNPMSDLSTGGFRLGVFSANADRGLSFSTVPEAWKVNWQEVLAAAQIADRGGIDFFLPIGRWRGYGGPTKVREASFETFTFAAGLASVTQRMALFMTVHVPLLHPLYAAKALATVDHISGGRAGWNEPACARCAWCVPPLHMTATPYCKARRAASTAEPTPSVVRRTRRSLQGSPMRRMAAASSVPDRKSAT
jgi:hypothetical protein